MEAKSNVQVDHVIPLVPLDRSFEEMSLDEAVDRAWCEEENLKIICKPCHIIKTKAENKERKRLKDIREGKPPKKEKVKRAPKSKKTPS
jgi:5-methylcytosine-specific restriction endonuclease McrA